MSQKDIENIKIENIMYTIQLWRFLSRKIEVSDSSKPIIIYDLCL